MGGDGFFLQAFVYLTAAVISVPIAKRLGLGSVLGYLVAGAAIGPYFLGLVGTIYFTVASAAGLWFLYRAIRLFQERTDEAAREVFRVSLGFLFAVFVAMLADLLISL